MQRSLGLIRKHILLALMVAYLFWAYFSTMAPGLSWANGGADGGDLIAAAATNGVAHPTGYPVYLLFAKLFQALPMGTLAFRTNILSALTMVGAAFWIYATVYRSIEDTNPYHKQLAGVISGLAFGLSPIVWSQSVITEVYALHAFFVSLVFYLISDPLLVIRRDRKVFLTGLILGLAFGNHVTMVLLVPAVIVAIGFQKQGLASLVSGRPMEKWQFMWKDLVRLIEGSCITLTLYLLLPFWAGSHPPINWGNPVGVRRFLWLVTGDLYRDQLVILVPWNIFERLQDWAVLLLQQFGFIGLALAVTGMVIMFVPSRMYMVTTWTMVVVSVFALLYQVNDWYNHLIPAFIAFSIWIGLGCSKIIKTLSLQGRVLGYFIGVMVIVYFIGISLPARKHVDASTNMRAENFGQEMVNDLPPNALVFAKGDQAVFALWYFHFALGERPDIIVMAKDLIHFDWYQENLRSIYPSLVLPGPFPFPMTIADANASHPVCFVQYTDETELECMPPVVAP